jgi:hypothetical protein
LRLLSVAEVQTALKLDAEQKSKLEKINAGLPTQAGVDFRNLSEEDGINRREGIAASHAD